MEAETCPPPHPEVGQCQAENKNPGPLSLPGGKEVGKEEVPAQMP